MRLFRHPLKTQGGIRWGRFFLLILGVAAFMGSEGAFGQDLSGTWRG